MVLYVCKRCGYDTVYKSTFAFHLNRKNPCDAIYNDTPLSDMLCMLEKKVGCYKCEGCQNVFTSPQSKYQHKKKCKSYAASLKVQDNKPGIQDKKEVLQNNGVTGDANESINMSTAGRDMVCGNMDNSSKTVNVFVNNFGEENEKSTSFTNCCICF